MTSQIGHNSLAELSDRATALIANSKLAAITDDDTAGKAVQLTAMMDECNREIEAIRKAQKQPHLDGGRAVDREFAAMSDPLDAARQVVAGMLIAYTPDRAPIRSATGCLATFKASHTVSGITDLAAAAMHCAATDPDALTEIVLKICNRQAKAGVREIPGVTLVEATSITVRG